VPYTQRNNSTKPYLYITTTIKNRIFLLLKQNESYNKRHAPIMPHLFWIHQLLRDISILRPSGLCLGLARRVGTRTNLDFTEARDSEWQWHQLGHMQICTLPQTDNNASTPPLSFLQARCPSCHPTDSVKALKAFREKCHILYNRKLYFVGIYCKN